MIISHYTMNLSHFVIRIRYGLDALHFVFSSTVVLLMVKFLPWKISPYVAFVFCMAHLSYGYGPFFCEHRTQSLHQPSPTTATSSTTPASSHTRTNLCFIAHHTTDHSHWHCLLTFFLFLLLSSCTHSHLYRLYYHYLELGLDWSLPQMILCCKLTGFAWHYHDGQVPEEVCVVDVRD